MEVMQNFKLFKPTTLKDAITFAAEQDGTRFLAGGTDLIVNLRRGIGEASALIDLSGIAEMKQITVDDSGARIGAGVTLAELAHHEGMAEAYSCITQAAGLIAGPTHQRFATVGGNLCLDTRCIYYNQSHWWRQSNDFCLKYKGEMCHVAPKSKICFAAFSGDLAPAMLLFEPQVDLIGPEGARTIALNELYHDDGAAHLTLKPGEFIVSITIPNQHFQHMTYEKLRVRDAIDFPLAGVAVALDRDGETLTRLVIAFTGTNCRPLKIAGLEDLCGKPLNDDMLGDILKRTNKQIKPMQSTSIPSTYRRAVGPKLAVRAIKKLWTL